MPALNDYVEKLLSGELESPVVVPNQHAAGQCRLAIIGEAPGEHEIEERRPFVGASGYLLFSLLSQFGLDRSQCFVGNVCQHRPPGNEFARFGWDHPFVQQGITQLEADLKTAKPRCILAVGNTALHFVRDTEASIDDWRGSVFYSDRLGCKVVATYHPARILHEYATIQLFRFDLRKAVRESAFPELRKTERHRHVVPTAGDVVQRLNEVAERHLPVAMDIEGGVATLKCISFATSRSDSFVVPFIKANGTRYFSEDEEVLVWRALTRVLASKSVPKILQNYLYDAFVLAYSCRTLIRGLTDDTMLKHWELLPELEKSLAVQASIYTDEPYYKAGRKTTGEDLWRYCATDSLVTFEIAEKLQAELARSPEGLWHYHFNRALLAPLLYMELRGIRYDRQAAATAATKTRTTMYELQQQVNLRAGKALQNGQDLLQLVKSQVAYKNCPAQSGRDIRFKAPYQADAIRIGELLDAGRPLTEAELGELSTLTDLHVNVNSNKQMVKLFDLLGYQPQFKKEHGRRTEKQTTDVLALLAIYTKRPDDFLLTLLRLRACSTELETLTAKADKDGRIRCAYNVVGTETGRMTCYDSPTGSGYNLQTVTKKHRHLFRADPGMFFFQCDLAGADGWTVAAHCASLGDRTMLDDYLFGLKPARIIALMYNGVNVAHLDKDELRKKCAAEVNDDGWLYFACKRVQHGTNYGMKEHTMSDQVLKDSYKLTGTPVFVKPDVCAKLAELYLQRYPGVRRWHARSDAQLKATGKLKGASGHTRLFFGRRLDPTTQKEYLADEPQENTTYATNLALWRMWTDRENRRDCCQDNAMASRDASTNETGGLPSLWIEPLHQVHDAICGQFPADRVSWAGEKLKQWFDNPLLIAGYSVTIPYEGRYGPSWGELTGKL